MVLFYLAAPIPTIMAKRYYSQTQGQGAVELAIFLTTGIVVSSFGLPIVLARAGTILAGACYLTVAGNIVVFLAIMAYFVTFDNEGNEYGY